MKTNSLALITIVLLGFTSCEPTNSVELTVSGEWTIHNIYVQTQDSVTNGSLFDTSYLEYTDPDSIPNKNIYKWNVGISTILSTKTIDSITTEETYKYIHDYNYGSGEKHLYVFFDPLDSTKAHKYKIQLDWKSETEDLSWCDLLQSPVYTQKTINGVPITLKTVRRLEMSKIGYY
jgi:hypothetical protein